jgi:hypothetical protein
VLYASSQEVSCFIETLARYSPDLTLLAELEAIKGDKDFFSLGTVQAQWCENRALGRASAEGQYTDICGGEWITQLRCRLASECLRSGTPDLDDSVLQSGLSRRITQLVSRVRMSRISRDRLSVSVLPSSRELGAVRTISTAGCDLRAD